MKSTSIPEYYGKIPQPPKQEEVDPTKKCTTPSSSIFAPPVATFVVNMTSFRNDPEGLRKAKEICDMLNSKAFDR